MVKRVQELIGCHIIKNSLDIYPLLNAIFLFGGGLKLSSNNDISTLRSIVEMLLELVYNISISILKKKSTYVFLNDFCSDEDNFLKSYPFLLYFITKYAGSYYKDKTARIEDSESSVLAYSDFTKLVETLNSKLVENSSRIELFNSIFDDTVFMFLKEYSPELLKSEFSSKLREIENLIKLVVHYYLESGQLDFKSITQLIPEYDEENMNTEIAKHINAGKFTTLPDRIIRLLSKISEKFKFKSLLTDHNDVIIEENWELLSSYTI